jgi:hypothetical protein
MTPRRLVPRGSVTVQSHKGPIGHGTEPRVTVLLPSEPDSATNDAREITHWFNNDTRSHQGGQSTRSEETRTARSVPEGRHQSL